jgi:FAD/FMN-containing dehydrogenase
VLVDTMGLGWFRPAPSFAFPMLRFVARPTPRSRDRLFNRCFLDMNQAGERAGEQWEPLLAYALDRARTPSVQAALRRLIPRVGMPPIPASDLERIAVPTTLIHGRHDLQVRLKTVEAASARYGWPLHVIEGCRDDPAVEQPEAFLEALRTVIGTPKRRGAHMSTRTFDVAGVEGGLVGLTSASLEQLNTQIDGPLLAAGDDGWDEAILIWNAMVATTPALVVKPTSVEDVVAAVRFASDHGLLLSVKGGGHNIAGTALADGGLTLDMSRMRDVTVDPNERLAYVDAGCLLQDVDRATQEHGLATVLGFVSETGVAGLTLGGGFGYLTRRFGWAADNLEEVEIVTADGKIRTANGTENPDLFWAIRGGGGNFGVVTRFTFRLHEVGPLVTGGLVAWSADRADEVLATYQQLTAAAPRELTAAAMIRLAPPAPFVPEQWHLKPVVGMLVCHSGSAAQADLAPLRALGEPIFNLVGEKPYVAQQSMVDSLQPKGMHQYWKSEFLPDLPSEYLGTFRDAARNVASPLSFSIIFHLAGALNDYDDGGAVGNRDARFISGFTGTWPPQADGDGIVAAVREAWEKMRPFSTGGNYVNFQLAEDDTTRTAAAYGDDYQRLRQVKAQYDPHNLFRVNRNIRPEHAPR